MKRKASNGKGSKRAKKLPKGTTQRSGFSSVARTRGASVQGEMKYFDTEVAQTTITGAAAWTGTEFDPTTFNTLFVPVVGAGVNQRIGKQCKVLKVRVTGMIQQNQQANQTVADDPAVTTVALVLDKQTNAAQAQGEQVFTPTTNVINAPFANQNIDNFGRFSVLKRVWKVLENPTISYDGTNIEQSGVTKLFSFKHKFKKPLIVRFNATNGGTVADIVDNSLHIMANSTTALSNIQYICRVYYKE